MIHVDPLACHIIHAMNHIREPETEPRRPKLRCDITGNDGMDGAQAWQFIYFVTFKTNASISCSSSSYTTPHSHTHKRIMLRQSIQRINTNRVCQTSLKSFTAAYTTSIQTSAKPIAPQVQQAENRATTWSKSQRAKADALVGPRFEQMDLSTQVNHQRDSAHVWFGETCQSKC